VTPGQIIEETITDYMDVGGSIWDSTELTVNIMDALNGHENAEMAADDAAARAALGEDVK